MSRPDLPLGAAQPEGRNEPSTAARHPAGGADRVRVEPDGDDADRQADQRGHGRQERVDAGQLPRGAATGQPALTEQDDAADRESDGQPLERQPSWAGAQRLRCFARKAAQRRERNRKRGRREHEDRAERHQASRERRDRRRTSVHRSHRDQCRQGCGRNRQQQPFDEV